MGVLVGYISKHVTTSLRRLMLPKPSCVLPKLVVRTAKNIHACT